jgi:hypothetical protein
VSKRTTAKNQLKRLKSAGLYSGKLPRGNTLTPYQQSLIKKFDAVAKGKATVLQPKDPSSYKRVFQVSGKNVIVPKGKGDKWTVTKSGNVQRARKGPRGEKITFTGWRQKKPGDIPPPAPAQKRVQYAVPFARKLGKGRYRLVWQRFPTYDELKKFMAEYEKRDEKGRQRYPDWTQYVFEESIDDARPVKERNQSLTDAAIKYGRAKPQDFEVTNKLNPILRVGRKARRKKVWGGRRWVE